MTKAIAQGTPVAEERLAPLVESSKLRDDPAGLRARLADEGYLFLPGVVDREIVLAARQEVFGRLEEVGEIEPPAVEGIATGTSQRREREPDLGAFWRSVSQGPQLRAASHGAQVQAVMDLLLGEPARAHDYIFLRPGVVGRSTSLHYDHPFFARGSDRVYTAWLALGDIPIEEGPLMVLEGSNRYADLVEQVRGIDYDSSDSPTVQVLSDTVEFARQRGSRLLASPFGAGDLVVFDMFTMHGSLDNHSPGGRVRLSCDVRWQPASDPVDPRYRGQDPPGTTGAGYGELNGAKPLDIPWHTR
jgi:hypothetical protein